MRNGRTNCARMLELCLALAVGIAATAGAEVQRVGVKTAKLAWAEPEGLVYGYVVYTQRNGGPSTYEATTAENQYTLDADFDDRVVVQVRAIGRNDPDGPMIASSFSPPSEPIHFVPSHSVDTSALAVMRSLHTDDIRVHLYSQANSLHRFPGRSAPWNPVAAGDFSGDSEAEILWQDETTGTLEVAALATPNATLAASSGTGPNHVLRGTGDLDGDGDLDLLVEDLTLDRVEMWHLTSDGSIRLATHFPGADGSSVLGISDLDLDGAEDVWTYREAGSLVEVFRADRRSSPMARYDVDALGQPERIIDVQGDGVPDLLWRTPSHGFAITYLGPYLRVERDVIFPSTTQDPYLEVKGAAAFSTGGARELILHNRLNQSMWLFLPSYEISENRFKILDSGSEGWAPFEILE